MIASRKVDLTTSQMNAVIHAQSVYPTVEALIEVHTKGGYNAKELQPLKELSLDDLVTAVFCGWNEILEDCTVRVDDETRKRLLETYSKLTIPGGPGVDPRPKHEERTGFKLALKDLGILVTGINHGKFI